MVFTPLLTAEVMPLGLEWVHWETLIDEDLGKRYPQGEHSSRGSFVTSGFVESGHDDLESLFILFREGKQGMYLTYKETGEDLTVLCERLDATYRELSKGMDPAITSQMGFTNPVESPTKSGYRWCFGVEAGKAAVFVQCGYNIHGEFKLRYWSGRATTNMCGRVFRGETIYQPAAREGASVEGGSEVEAD